MADQTAFEGWAIVELMGHRRISGYVQEQQIAGAGMLRIDVVPTEGETLATQFFSPSAVYCITPTTEEMAKATARSMFGGPVTSWELQQLKAGRTPEVIDYEDDEDDE